MATMKKAWWQADSLLTYKSKRAMKHIVLDLAPMERNMVGYLLYQERERNKELPDGKTWELIYDVWQKAVSKARTIKDHD